jgi:hypothetical protein
MEIEVSIGEIVDKLSILDIKRRRITNSDKLFKIENEYNYLHKIVFTDLNINTHDYEQLLIINEQLWDIEDDIRIKEKNKEFDEPFIELARLVYITNDIRFELKKVINIKYGSNFSEEKSYEPYN